MGAHLENVGAQDIVDGNPRLTLGLTWTIILHYQKKMKKKTQKMFEVVQLEEMEFALTVLPITKNTLIPSRPPIHQFDECKQAQLMYSECFKNNLLLLSTSLMLLLSSSCFYSESLTIDDDIHGMSIVKNTQPFNRNQE
ncbi:Plectin [Schistosoma japonicum]|nr:Plectin [Schistosoma japonicum]